jgi:hypothetical protein
MISDHEVPLAIGVLKGTSWVSTHYKSGLLLYNRVSSNYWAVVVTNYYKYIKGIFDIRP